MKGQVDLDRVRDFSIYCLPFHILPSKRYTMYVSHKNVEIHKKLTR